MAGSPNAACAAARRVRARRGAAGLAACVLWLTLAQGGCSVTPEDIRYRDSRQSPMLRVPDDLTRPVTGTETAIPALPDRGVPDPWAGEAGRGAAIERPPAMVME